MEPVRLCSALYLCAEAVRAELVVRQAHHDRFSPNILSEVEGQAQGERVLAFCEEREGGN